jgi:uncharacterized protein (DUF2384 family)
MIVVGFSASMITLLCDVGIMSPEERDRTIPLKALKKLVSNQLLSVDESYLLFRFAHITAITQVIYGDEGKAKQWLIKPKSRFSGKVKLRCSLQPMAHIGLNKC